MKTKQILSIVLSLVLMLSLLPMTAFADVPETESGTESVSFTMSVSIAEGTDTPGNYGVEYQVVDANGNDVNGEGFKGYYSGNQSAANVNLTGLGSDYKVKILVTSAGLGIRLDGADVSEEGWSEGKSLSLTELRNRKLAFELFQKADNQNPGEGGNQEPGEGGAVTYTVDFGTGSWVVGDVIVSADKKGQEVISEADVISLTNFNAETMEVKVSAAGGFGTTLRVNGNSTMLSEKNNDGGLPNTLTFQVVAKSSDDGGNGDPGPEPDPNPPHGGYIGDKVTANVTITGEADFYINDSKMINSQNGENQEVSYTYNKNGNVDFYVSWFINEKYTSFTINDVNYLDELPIKKQDLLNACKGQLYEVRIEVPYRENYEINAEKGGLSGEDMPVGNFLWTYNENEKYLYDQSGEVQTDEDGNAILNDDYIDHGRMDLVSIKYNDITYSGQELEDKLSPDSAFDWSEPGGDGWGGAVLPAGAEVTVKLVPEYGYQLTSFGINGGEFVTGKEQSTFTFEIKGGNFHLAARFTQVEDKVASASNKVTSGNIQLGASEIDTGSVVLSVDDAKNYSEESFENAIKNKDGYQIDSVLDINLNQVIYKGNEESFWSSSMSSLKQPAEISLQLDGDYQDPVVVHETHEGTYEVIDTTYDSATGTITFKTDSFSYYAVAVNRPVNSKRLSVDFDSWGEGEEAQAQVMAKIGKGEAFPVEAGKTYQYGEEDTEISFTLTPPQEREKFEPIVEVELWGNDSEPEIQKPDLKKVADTDRTYEFCIASDKECAEMIVHVWWSEFDQFWPNEQEIMITANTPDGAEAGMIRLDQDAERQMSLDGTTKYIFPVGTEVTAEFAPNVGKRLTTVYIYFDRYSDVEDDSRPLSDLYSGGKYQYTIKDLKGEIYLEALFDDCDHSMISKEGSLISAVEATCTEAGSKAYYICSCGKWFEDAEANVEITSEEWIVIPAKGHQVEAKSLEPTFGQDGYKTYYECKECHQAFVDAQGKNELTDLTSWKTGEGRIPSLGEQFGVYKKDGQAKAEGKKQKGDSAAVTKLIETAKAAIGELNYDTSRNLDDNKKNVDDILDKMEKEVADQRITEAGFVPDEIENKPTAGKVVNITSEVKGNSLNASLSNIPTGAISLTEEERENGAYVWLELNTVSADSDTAAAFAGKLKGYSIGAYMEIDLFKMTTDGNVNAISDTNSAVSVTVTVPDDMLNKDTGIIRTFYIARNHNGVVEILGATYDANAKTLTFKTDKFSDYAIIYRDAQRKNNVADNQTKATTTAARTGDGSNQILWITLLLLSGMYILGTYIVRRRRVN